MRTVSTATTYDRVVRMGQIVLRASAVDALDVVGPDIRAHLRGGGTVRIPRTESVTLHYVWNALWPEKEVADGTL